MHRRRIVLHDPLQVGDRQGSDLDHIIVVQPLHRRRLDDRRQLSRPLHQRLGEHLFREVVVLDVETLLDRRLQQLDHLVQVPHILGGDLELQRLVEIGLALPFGPDGSGGQTERRDKRQGQQPETATLGNLFGE